MVRPSATPGTATVRTSRASKAERMLAVPGDGGHPGQAEAEQQQRCGLWHRGDHRVLAPMIDGPGEEAARGEAGIARIPRGRGMGPGRPLVDELELPDLGVEDLIGLRVHQGDV